MMTMRRALALLLLLLAFAGAGWLTWRGLFSAPRIDSALQQRIAASSISLAYVLHPDRWLEFAVEPGTHHIRIVTNANLPASLASRPEDVWKYALALELVDAGGKVLLAREYHQRASLTRLRDPKSGEEFTPSFYLTGELHPTDGKLFLLNPAAYGRVAKLRVRLSRADPAIASVVVRAYAPQKLAEYKLAHQWQRLTEQEKKQAARGNIYGHELLLESEIANLLREREAPLAPSGVRGRAYQALSLYVMREYEGQVVETPITPAGVLVDHDLKGIIPIPERSGQVRLELAATGVGAPPPEDAPLHIRWIGRGPLERASRTERWRGASLSLTQAWQGGLLEISAPGRLVARAYLATAEGEQEITPEPMYARTFVADAAPVSYAIEHLGDAATPLRVDLRHFATEPAADGTISPPMVGYELLDGAGKVVREGRILIDPPPTQYERPASADTGPRASDPSTYYFSLPAAIARIRFHADKRVLVSAFNRPRDLVHEIRVPEDAYVADEGSFRQPAWFAMRPMEYERLLLDNRSLLLVPQSRPPEDQPELLAGRYLWEDYHPQGAWLGRHLFTPERDVGRLRDESLPSLFRPLAPGRDERVHLQGPGAGESIQATLLVLHETEAPFQLKLTVDGRLHHAATVSAAVSEIPLPALAAGAHRVRIDGPAYARYYLNYAGKAPGSLLRRLGNRFDGRALSFIYQRTTRCEETLSVRLHVPHGAARRSRVLASVSLPADALIGPVRGWTFGARRYDLRPDPSARVPVVGVGAGAGGQVLDRGQAFFIPLGEDLPPGRYRFDFRLEQGVPGYLSFSKITPGGGELRRISTEQETRNVSTSE